MSQGTTSWRSKGDGSFEETKHTDRPCDIPIDFNGDGRADCLTTSGYSLSVATGTHTTTKVADFQLKKFEAGVVKPDPQPLSGDGIGIAIVDFNGDGREDILRWTDGAPYSSLHLSQGDGTFMRSAIFDQLTDTRFRSSNGAYNFVVGDFTGRGVGDILRLSSSAPQGNNPSDYNNLYLHTHPGPSDLLMKVTGPTGLVTTLTYEALPVMNRLTNRLYTPDRGRGPPYEAVYPQVDIIAPLHVVTQMITSTGVGTNTATTLFSYAGLKGHLAGRGMLGFRELRRESDGASADGGRITTVTQYLQEHPYTGSPKRALLRLGGLNDNGAVLQDTYNYYCDARAPAGSEATFDAPCQITSLLKRPYLQKTIRKAWDLAGPQLPTMTTVNTYSTSGDPTQIKVSTAKVGVDNQDYDQITSNTYHPDDTSGDNWSIGRIANVRVTKTVPNLLASLTTNAGSGTHATKTEGTPPSAWQRPVSTAALNAIIQLLLLDEDE
jgi:hypothetical protein